MLVASCAAPRPPMPLHFTLVDRASGARFSGEARPTAASAGSAAVDVDGQPFTGDYVIVRPGTRLSTTSASLSNGLSASVDTMSASTYSNGQAHLNAPGGAFLRCTFNFDSAARSGLGECEGVGGRRFDLTVTR
jgi:hypothetical protein